MQCALALHPTVLQHADRWPPPRLLQLQQLQANETLAIARKYRIGRHGIASHRIAIALGWRRLGSTPVCRTTVPLQAGGRFRAGEAEVWWGR
jgi:hypothetical protein